MEEKLNRQKQRKISVNLSHTDTLKMSLSSLWQKRTSDWEDSRGKKKSSCSRKRCLQSKSNQLEKTNNLHTDNPQHWNTWQTKHWLSPHKRVRYTVLDSKWTVSAWSWANREMSNHKDLRDSDKGQTRQLGPTEVVQGAAHVTVFWLAKTGLCSLMLQKSYSRINCWKSSCWIRQEGLSTVQPFEWQIIK